MPTSLATPPAPFPASLQLLADGFQLFANCMNSPDASQAVLVTLPSFVDLVTAAMRDYGAFVGVACQGARCLFYLSVATLPDEVRVCARAHACVCLGRTPCLNGVLEGSLLCVCVCARVFARVRVRARVGVSSPPPLH